MSVESCDSTNRNVNATESPLDVMMHAYGWNFDGWKCERAVALMQTVASYRMSAWVLSSIRQAYGRRWKMCETAACGLSLRSNRDFRVRRFAPSWCSQAPSCRLVPTLSA